MKTLIALALFAASIIGALAQTHVRGYYRKDGTYVEPHWRSNPNSTTYDNWSTRGNVNPIRVNSEHGKMMDSVIFVTVLGGK